MSEEYLMRIQELAQKLAAAQANSARLLGELESTRNGLLWWMDAFPLHVTEADHEEMAKLDQALALPYDDTALMEWGAKLLEKVEADSHGEFKLSSFAKQLRSGEWKP